MTGMRGVKTLKPTFNCNAKYLVSGVGVGHCPRRQNFALEIPTCWYFLALPNAKICDTPDAKPKICVTPDANPRRQSVEYRWRWVFWCWQCILHVYFMYISSCLCIIFRVGYVKISRRKGRFQWNMGLRLDYCGFGPFCSTGTKLLLSISLLMVLICIIYQ